MIDLLLIGGTVVTMDPDRRVLQNGAVAIDGGRIVAVGSAEDLVREYEAQKTIDCRGKAVLPGLIDAHGHGGHSLIKTIGSDTPTFWMRIVTTSYPIGITFSAHGGGSAVSLSPEGVHDGRNGGTAGSGF